MEAAPETNGTSESEVCTWIHREKELFLQPHYFNCVQKGVGDAMDAMINKYQADLGGIVRRHKNVKLLSVDGTITDEESYIKLNVKADFEVFSPFVGCKLKGVVNKVSGNNVSCLVYELFNISCPNFMENQNWIGYEATVGQEITCQVTKVDMTGRIPYIRASIVKLHEVDEKNEVEKKNNHLHWNEDDYEVDEEELEIIEPTVAEDAKSIHEVESTEEEKLSEDESSEKNDSDGVDHSWLHKLKSVNLKEKEVESEEENLATPNRKHKNKKSFSEQSVDSDDQEEPKKLKKKKRKSRHSSEDDYDVLPSEKREKVKIKEEIISSESEVETTKKAKKKDKELKKSLKRKRKSDDVQDSPKSKSKKKRKILVNGAGDQFYYDEDGCPIFV